jgi:hypothetical protein
MNAWLKFFISLFGFGEATAKAVSDRTDPEEVKVSKHEIKKPTLELNERLKRQNKIFNRIKNVPDADVRNSVLEFTDLNEEDTNLMVSNISARINEYRRDHPIISGWRRFTKRN